MLTVEGQVTLQLVTVLTTSSKSVGERKRRARPEAFQPRHAEFLEACRLENRDPAAIAVTVGLYVLYPEHLSASDRESLPESLSHPDKALRGTPGEIAAGLQAMAILGIEHLICNPVPNTPATHAELLEALRLARA